MSLINQMLQDLDKRGTEEVAPSRGYAQYGDPAVMAQPRSLQGLFALFVLVGLLALAFAIWKDKSNQGPARFRGIKWPSVFDHRWWSVRCRSGVYGNKVSCKWRDFSLTSWLSHSKSN